VETRGQAKEIKADAVLVTVGRRPNSERLGLENVGIQVDSSGKIPVSETMETCVPGIYAIGDLVDGPMLAHKASKEGEVAAEVIAGHASAMDVAAIPAVIFTDPEIATVGLSEAEATSQGYQVKTGKFPFAANGRALTTGKADGFVRIISDKASDVVLGAEIVGPQASDLIAEATLGLEMASFTADLGLTVHAHPTLSEGLMEAAAAADGAAIHMLNR
jgi:dihydrolipoamide dehydrogenase